MQSRKFDKKCLEEKFLILLFKELANNSIKYSVLRNYEGLPFSLNGSDLDILLPAKEWQAFSNVLTFCLNKTKGLIISQYKVGVFWRKCICGRLSNRWWGLQIDCHLDEAFLGIPFYDKDELIERSLEKNGVKILCHGDAAILALLKEALSNSKSRKNYDKKAVAAYNQDKGYYKKQFIKYFGHKVSISWETFFDSDLHPEKLKRLATDSRLALLHISIKQHPLTATKSFIIYYWDRLARITRPPGFSIAVLGVDGSGKSTVILGVSSQLSPAVHKDILYEHLRPNLIPSISELFGRKVSPGPTTDPHGSVPSGFVGSLLRLSYYFFDYTFGYFWKIHSVMIRRSCIWIFDRYFYDFLIDPFRSRISLPKWIIKTFSFFIAKPNLILCLGADPKKIHERKPELTLQEVERQIKELTNFCDNTENAVWIDTGCSEKESIGNALEAITSAMASRYNGAA